MKQINYDPKEKLTRGEFVMELLDTWQDTYDTAVKKGYKDHAQRLLNAIEVLKVSYATRELMDFKGLLSE